MEKELEVLKNDKEPIDEYEAPKYTQRIELTKELQKQFSDEIKDEMDAIEKERQEIGLYSKINKLQHAYDKSQANEDPNDQFDVHRGITRENQDKAVNRYIDAFEGDGQTIFSMSPRPEFAEEDGMTVADAQEGFIDYKMDEVIKWKQPLRLAVHQARLFGLGWLRWSWKVTRKDRKKKEVFKGNNEYFVKVDGQRIDLEEDEALKLIEEGIPVEQENTELERFLKEYPDAAKKHPSWVETIAEGGTKTFRVSYKETTYNDPMPKFCDIRNVYVRVMTEWYEGLKNAKLKGEVVEYTWWDLKKKERDGEFENVYKLMYESKEDERADKKLGDYKNKKFKIFECELYTEIEDELVLIQCVYSMDRKFVLCAKNWDYDTLETEYLPFWVKITKAGMYQDGIAEDTLDENIAIDAFLKLALQGLYRRVMTTPLVKRGSETARQFLEKRYVDGMPIYTDGNDAPDFLQKYMSQLDLGGVLSMIQFLNMGVGSKTAVTEGISGKADPVDPSAPATKTLALLGEAKTDIRAQVAILAPSFVQIGQILLALYHQNSDEPMKYNLRPENVVQGENPFARITQDQLRMRTNIQVQATVYAFDKLNEKRELVALYQLIRPEKLIAENPQAVNFLLRWILKRWSGQVANEIDKLLPKPEDMTKRQVITAAKGAELYVNATIEKFKATGVPPEFDPNALMQTIQQLEAGIATPQEQE